MVKIDALGMMKLRKAVLPGAIEPDIHTVLSRRRLDRQFIRRKGDIPDILAVHKNLDQTAPGIAVSAQ